MTKDKPFARFMGLLNEKRSYAVCLAGNASYDGVAAGIALYFGLLKAGYDVICVSDTPVREDMGILGIEKLTNSLVVGGSTLVASFPYKEGAVDKVTYNIENDRFRLVITPREDGARLEPKDVQFEYTGGKPQVVITIEAPQMDALGKVYTDHPDMYTGATIVNIDRRQSNTNYGSINIIRRDVTSTSELVLDILKEARIELDEVIATNLLVGMIFATGNFSATTANPDTLENAAFLMRSGARKQQLTQAAQGAAYLAQSAAQPPQQQGYAPPQQSPQGTFAQPYPQAAQPQMAQPQMAPQGYAGPTYSPIPQANPQTQNIPVSGYQDTQSDYGDQQEVFSQKAHEEITTTTAQISNLQNIISEAQAAPQEIVENKEAKPQAPSDWLKPKIFKGTNIV